MRLIHHAVVIKLGFTLFLFLPDQVTAAGFDCKKAITDVEKLICKNHELSTLDDKLSSVYRQILETTELAETKKLVKSAQQDWLRKTRDACKEAQCLLQVYRQRIAELEKTYFDFSRPFVKYLATVKFVEDEPTKSVREYSCRISQPGKRGGIYLSYTGNKLSDFSADDWIVNESPDLRYGYTWGLSCEARLNEFNIRQANGSSPKHSLVRLVRKPEVGTLVNFRDCRLDLVDTETQLQVEAINPSKCSLYCLNIKMVLDKKLERCRILEL